MRFFLKKQILEILNQIKNLLIQALDSTDEIQKRCKLNEVVKSMWDVQIFMESYKEEQNIDKYFNDFCASINQYIKNNKCGEEQRLKAYLVHVIEMICEEIKTQIETKYEIVFLPYKADMWTSMDSIWRSAKEKKNIEVKVIPIPYYDIGNPKDIKLIYEGDRFLKELEVIHYADYNFEEMHPDIIIIHNGYDNCNKLTRVPEMFYSKNMRNYTEKLVYSPYFTTGTYNEATQDVMYLVPGTFYSDYIVAQSEEVKKIFVKCGHNENKILSYGSPKVDALIRAMKEKREIPEEWREKIEGKKVFLLNTHLLYFKKAYMWAETMDNYAVKFHNEICDTFLNKKDCALIFRPHPLLKSEMRNNSQQCLEYIEWFENEIKMSDNGIVDENGDYLMSFGCSDALISTWSSLVNEYMVTGKPVMIFQRKLEETAGRINILDRNKNYFRVGQEKITFSEFRDLVIAGNDPMKEERMNAVRRAFPNLDGLAGQKILDRLLDM